METERLIFREITIEDTNNIVAWRSNPNVYKFFLNPHKVTEEEHKEWYFNRYLPDNNRTDYIAILKNYDLSVGVFGLIFDSKNSQVEVNYLLDESFRGRGLAKEAVSYLLSFSKSNYSCKYAIAEIHVENFASQTLAKRLGFIETTRKGEFILFRKELW